LSVAATRGARSARPVTTRDTDSRRAWPTWALVAVVGVLSVLPYLPALRAEFLTFDDDAYVTENRFVRQGLAVPSIRWAFTTFSEGNYHPLTWLSLMLDAEVWGVDPAGFHLTSILLHAANAIVLLLILLRVGAPAAAAVLGALVWAMHPLRVESVAWISERKDVLSALFGLLAVHAYLGPRERGDERRGAVWRAAPWMALSLLCKAMFVTLPALLVLLDFWPLGRIRSTRDLVRSVLAKWPLWLLAVAFSVLAVLSQSSRAAMMDLSRMPLTVRVPNALMSYGRYLLATLWPSDLAAFYPFPVDGWPAWQWLVMAVVLFLTTLAVWLLRTRWPALLVGWGWYVIALSPVSGVMQTGGQAMADRFTYVPAIGLVLAAVGVLPALTAARRRVAGTVAAVACVVLATFAWLQTALWRDTITLMQHTIAVTPLNLYAQSQLAHAYLARGDTDRALALYGEVQRVRPDIAQVQINLGVIAAQRGDQGKAIEHYRNAIALEPGSFEAHNNLAAALLELQRPQEAAAALEQALRIRPDDPDALFNVGMAYSQIGNLPAAAEVYERVVALTPDDAEARYRLGVLKLHLGDRGRAIAELRAALAAAPQHAGAAAALREAEGGAPATSR
jgi:Tfp pilus assembly protein PilF